VLESNGVPVGLFPGARFSSTSFEVAPGEQLVLYTDGVTESANELDREYGFDALWSLVSHKDLELTPAEAAARYLGDVTRHRHGRVQQDDLTLMVLRRDCRPLEAFAIDQRASSSSL
jgi:sigma-B regulation protein RsbU (phosphoserine phosphatase)